MIRFLCAKDTKIHVRTVGFRMWMVSPEASQFFMRKISRRSCCDWYNCVGFYVTDENTKIREARCDQPRDITDLLLCMPSEATTFDFNVSHVRHSRKYTQQSRCRDAHHADEMRHASGARASCYQNCLLHAWRLRPAIQIPRATIGPPSFSTNQNKEEVHTAQTEQRKQMPTT